MKGQVHILVGCTAQIVKDQKGFCECDQNIGRCPMLYLQVQQLG